MNTPAKPTFLDLFQQSGIDYELLVVLSAEIARVPQSILNDMIAGRPVMKCDAERVLRILSEHTGTPYNLDAVEMPLFAEVQSRRPTILDLYMEHRFDIHTVAFLASVPDSTLTAMVGYQPVELAEAQRVLVQLSKLLHKELTLDTVDVPLIQGEEQA